MRKLWVPANWDCRWENSALIFNINNMILSNKNALALLLDINEDIEEYAEATVKNIIEEKNFDIMLYPPNNGLTDQEKAALSKLDNNEHLKNALRKMIANNTAEVVFNILNLLDGTASPKKGSDDWTGVKLVDEDDSISMEPFQDTLHDKFMEVYWDWKKLRGNKS
jgi:hypothetical protein